MHVSSNGGKQPGTFLRYLYFTCELSATLYLIKGNLKVYIHNMCCYSSEMLNNIQFSNVYCNNDNNVYCNNNNKNNIYCNNTNNNNVYCNNDNNNDK